MHPFSVLALSIFVAGYITARWDLVTRLYELAIFAWDHGVVVCIDSACRTIALMWWMKLTWKALLDQDSFWFSRDLSCLLHYHGSRLLLRRERSQLASTLCSTRNLRS